MNVSITDAKARLTDLVRRAEAGEEIVLTRHGYPAVELRPVRAAEPGQVTQDREARYRRIMEISRRAAEKVAPGPDAAHAADHLYDDNGLPI